MAMHTLTALFEARPVAAAAAADLRRRGLSSDVELSPDLARPGEAAPKGRGFWAWLETLFRAPAERDAYAEAVSRGETVLTAVVAEARVEEAVGLLDRHLSTRVDRRSQTWREVAGTGGGSVRLAGQASLSRIAHELAEPADDAPCPDPGRRQGASRTWKARIGMDVVGADGTRIGVVDGVQRDAVTLAAEGRAGGRHRIPEEWIAAIDSRVALRLTGPDAMRCWVALE